MRLPSFTMLLTIFFLLGAPPSSASLCGLSFIQSLFGQRPAVALSDLQIQQIASEKIHVKELEELKFEIDRLKAIHGKPVNQSVALAAAKKNFNENFLKYLREGLRYLQSAKNLNYHQKAALWREMAAHFSKLKFEWFSQEFRSRSRDYVFMGNDYMMVITKNGELYSGLADGKGLIKTLESYPNGTVPISVKKLKLKLISTEVK